MAFGRKKATTTPVKDEDAERGYSITDPTHELNQRKPNEPAHKYNERVPIQFQPILENNVSYRGKKLS